MKPIGSVLPGISDNGSEWATRIHTCTTREPRSRVAAGARMFPKACARTSSVRRWRRCFSVSRRAAPYAMIGATLTTRLAQYGITKSAVTMFALAFLAYNFKFLWAPLVDNVRIPLLGRFGQRRSWLWLTGVFVMAAVVFLGSVDPQQALTTVAIAAVLVGVAGATFDIIIDAYRIELLEPRQLGVGSGMSQYGWRIGAAGAGAVALVVAARYGWAAAYTACALFALPAMLVGVAMGEPAAAPRAGCRARRHSGRRCVFQPACRVHQARRGADRPRVRPDSQDWRHARESHAAVAVPGSRIHQRRNRVLRRRRRLHRAAGWACSSAGFSMQSSE